MTWFRPPDDRLSETVNDHLMNELAHARVADLRHTAREAALARDRRRSDAAVPLRLVFAHYAALYRLPGSRNPDR